MVMVSVAGGKKKNFSRALYMQSHSLETWLIFTQPVSHLRMQMMSKAWETDFCIRSQAMPHFLWPSCAVAAQFHLSAYT